MDVQETCKSLDETLDLEQIDLGAEGNIKMLLFRKKLKSGIN